MLMKLPSVLGSMFLDSKSLTLPTLFSEMENKIIKSYFKHLLSKYFLFLYEVEYMLACSRKGSSDLMKTKINTFTYLGLWPSDWEEMKRLRQTIQPLVNIKFHIAVVF